MEGCVLRFALSQLEFHQKSDQQAIDFPVAVRIVGHRTTCSQMGSPSTITLWFGLVRSSAGFSSPGQRRPWRTLVLSKISATRFATVFLSRFSEPRIHCKTAVMSVQRTVSTIKRVCSFLIKFDSRDPSFSGATRALPKIKEVAGG